MDEREVIELIRARVIEAGSMRALAREWNIAVSYVSDLVSGRRAPGRKVLEPLGLIRRKRVDYVPAKGDDDADG